MMRVVAIVQARMGSTRLPGKILEPIAGVPMLERVLRRTACAALVSEVVVATSERAADDVVVDAVDRLGLCCVRGSELDVLDRYHAAAEQTVAEAVVRITSDCPLIDPEVVDRVVEAFLAARPDYAANTLERTYPRGLDTEVIAFPALERAWREADRLDEREHVTPYIWQQPTLFRLLSVTGEEDHSRHRWTVDTADDLRLVRTIFERLGDWPRSSWREVLRLLEAEPELALINAHVVQKTLGE